jgi:hypothetical protein
MRRVSQLTSKCIQRAALCALVLYVAAPAAIALPNEQQIAAYDHATENERVKLLIFLAKQGDAESVDWLLQKFPLEGPHAKNRALYISGLLKRSKGNLTGAAKDFRAALATDPSLTLVRSELAQILVELQENDSAKHHLELLAAEAPDQATVSGIRSFIDQIDAQTPFKYNAYVSMAPSTNLNGGSNHKKVYLDFNGLEIPIALEQPESGVGFSTGSSVGYSKRLGNDFMFVAAANADATLYRNEDYNTYSMSQSAEIRRMFSRGYLGLGLVASQTLAHDEFAFSTANFGPRLSMNWQVDAKNSIGGSAIFQWNNYFENDTSATTMSLNTSWTHGFSSTFNTTLFSSISRYDNGNAFKSYTTSGNGISIYKELPQGITANLTGQAALSIFDGFNEGIGKRRQDLRLTGTIALTKRDFNIFGYAPSIEYSYSNNLSDLDYADTHSHSFDFRLTKEF